MEQVALNRHEEYFKDNVGDGISQPIRQCQPEVFEVRVVRSRLSSAEAVAVDLVNSHLVADNSFGGIQ